MDRNLETLATFQKISIQMISTFLQIGRDIRTSALESKALLRDRISSQTIEDIMSIAQNIDHIGMAYEKEMKKHYKHTRELLDIYNELNKP